MAKADRALREWAQELLGKDPWDPGLYDMLVPMGRKPINQVVGSPVRHASGGLLADSAAAGRAASDYRLSAQVQAEIAAKGHQIKVFADRGNVTLEINKKVFRFNRLEAELKKLAGKVPGVGQVTVKPGPKAHRADTYRSMEFGAPGKILLVDDEREFVETLSERLLMRNMDASVVYDGEQALELLQKEVPEIMVLDLMMPGIDGMEVLRRVKESHPQVEVIMLTGHGSEKDRKACKEAGAFEYLQKPVDIEDLSLVMRKAAAKARGVPAGEA